MDDSIKNLCAVQFQKNFRILWNPFHLMRWRKAAKYGNGHGIFSYGGIQVSLENGPYILASLQFGVWLPCQLQIIHCVDLVYRLFVLASGFITIFLPPYPGAGSRHSRQKARKICPLDIKHLVH
ncbi:hypothetical protein AC1031_022091 [Aphanomyces cochlioides]|nr:hypothetical protein AC1031_022091 [Aphanomyces cochlioides]